MTTTTLTIDSLTLAWSDYTIAKNLNYFRQAEPTEAFWDLWKSNKDELKALGLSVYKPENQFFVYDWSRKDKATQEQYDAQETLRVKKAEILEEITPKIKFHYYYEYVLGWIEDSRDLTSKQRHKMEDEVQSMTTLDEIEEFIECESSNPETIYEDIEINYGGVIRMKIQDELKKRMEL
jgi:hypothetical protein